MDNCCDWHGGLIGKEEIIYDNRNVEVTYYFCPECNSLYKQMHSLNDDKSYLTYYLWGDDKQKYLSIYKDNVDKLYHK